MDSELCRLCAKLKRPAELKVSIGDQHLCIEQKLIDCCRWNQFREHKNLPKKVCQSCFQKLENSWAFAKSVASAQKKLLADVYDEDRSKYIPIVTINEGYLSTAQEHTTSTILNQDALVKQEFSDDNSASIAVKNEVKSEFEGIFFSGNDFNEQFPKDNDDFGVPRIEGLENQGGNSLDFDILPLLSLHDLNENGTIKPEKIQQLNLNDWSICKYKCWKCSNLFEDLTTLKEHMGTTHPNDILRYACSLCSHQRTYRENHRGMFSQHVISEHFPHLKYCCFKCQKFFWDLEKLKKHKKDHPSDTRSFICSTCGKGFYFESILKNHYRMHLPTELKPIFECYRCRKTFCSKLGLQTHFKTHYNKKQYTCEECGKSFRHKCDLQEHLLCHSSDRPFSCDMCEKTFKSSRMLKRHKHCHRSANQFECNVCGVRLSTKSTLKKHLLIHTNELPHPCDLCEKHFRSRGNMLVHRRIHTGERPYSCNVCEYKAREGWVLNKHMKQKHGIVT